jgi:hypothetical protein
MLERLLLLVSLPLVSWSSHVTFDLVPETGNRGAGTLAAFPTAAGGWSSTYYDDARGRLIAGCNIGCASGRPVGLRLATVPATYEFAGVTTMEIGHVPGLPGGVDGLIADPAPNGLPGYAFNAYLVKMLDLPQYSGIGTSTAEMDFTADGRNELLSMDSGAHYSARFAGGKNSAAAHQASKWKNDSGMEIMSPNAPASQWLRISYSRSDSAAMDSIDWHRQMGEPLALCLIGIIAMIAYVLRHLGEIGTQHTGRRRKAYRDVTVASFQRQARDRAHRESEEHAEQGERPREEFPVASLYE